MSTTTESPAGTATIRPFAVPVTPEAELEALRARITATRWPDPELVTDFSQGVQQAVTQELPVACASLSRRSRMAALQAPGPPGHTTSSRQVGWPDNHEDL